MKKNPFALIAFLLFLTGCQNANSVVDVITFQPADYKIMFLSDDNPNKKTKEIYLDAILELKSKYPSEFTNIKMNIQKKDELQQLIDTEYPALLIMKNGQTISHLYGKHPKAEIIKQLEMTIQK